MSKDNNQDINDKYADQALQWYGWGSPVGISIALMATGVFLWLLHLANIIK